MASGTDPQVHLTRLKHTIQALAAKPDAQLAIYPDFACKVDELALDFEHWLDVSRNHKLLSEAELSLLAQIDSMLDDMSGPDGPWSEDGLRTDPRWATIRLLAKDALERFGWPLEDPPKSPDTFVEFKE